MTGKTVYGFTLTTFSSPHLFPELRERYEAMSRDELRARYGVRTAEQRWRHEQAYTWTDPDTDEEYDVPERWMLFTEGWEK